MSRIFLVEPNRRYDIAGTKDYGEEVIYLVSSPLNPFDTANAIKEINQAFRKSNFDPDYDYICMTGQTIMLALFLSVALQRYHSVKILLFDARQSKYKSRIIELE